MRILPPKGSRMSESVRITSARTARQIVHTVEVYHGCIPIRVTNDVGIPQTIMLEDATDGQYANAVREWLRPFADAEGFD